MTRRRRRPCRRAPVSHWLRVPSAGVAAARRLLSSASAASPAGIAERFKVAARQGVAVARALHRHPRALIVLLIIVCDNWLRRAARSTRAARRALPIVEEAQAARARQVSPQISERLARVACTAASARGEPAPTSPPQSSIPQGISDGGFESGRLRTLSGRNFRIVESPRSRFPYAPRQRPAASA